MFGKKNKKFFKIFIFIFAFINLFSFSFGIEMGEIYNIAGKNTSNQPTINILDYTQQQIITILYNMTQNSTKTEYIEMYEKLLSDLDNGGIKYVAYKYNSEYWLLTENPNIDFDLAIGYNEKRINYDNSPQHQLFPMNETLSDTEKIGCFIFAGRSSLKTMHSYGAFSNSYVGIDLLITEFLSSNTDIYEMKYVDDDEETMYWDGASYFYKHTSSGGNEGGNTGNNTSDFTDEQIAEIVERLINSDVYLEKAYYNGDYFITYDNLTGYFRGYSYAWNIDLAIEYGNYNEEGEFVTTGTKEGEAWRIRPYEFSGDIFVKFGDWLASKFNTYSFEYFSISPDSSIKPRYVGSLEHNYCSNSKENEVVIYSSKQIRYVGEETNSEGETETIVTDNYIPPTVLKDSVTGEQIVIRDNLQNSSDSLENVITPNADFSGLKEVFDKYISFIDISSITWLTTAISSMITIFVPFVALGIIIFLINRILNGGS